MHQQFAQLLRIGRRLAAGQHHARAVRQRQEQLQRGDVERQRGDSDQHVVAAHARRLSHAVQEVGQVGAVERHTFWFAGRTGRVDHVGQAAARRQLGRIGGVANVQRCRVGVQAEHRHAAGRHGCQQAVLGQQHHRRSVLQHVGQAVGRIGRVQRHIGAAGFQDGQQAHHHFQRALHAQAHQHVRAHAQRAQVMRQTVGPRIQLAIRQRYIVILQRHAIRRGRRAFLKQRRHHRRRPVVARRVVPFHQQLAAFGVVQHVQILDAALRVGHDRFQQAREVPRHAVDGRRVEQISVVFEYPLQTALGLAQIQCQIEFGGCMLRHHFLHGQAVQGHRLLRHVLQHQHHLEQRRMAGMALRLEYLHQLFERHILMRVSVQCGAAHLLQQLRETFAGIHPGPQHQRIGEEADQLLGLQPVAVGDRRTDADIVLSGVARQQHVEGRRQRHEQRALAIPGQRLEACDQLAGQADPQRCAAVALIKRAWTVRRQRQQGRRAAQLLLPVGQALLQEITAEPLALPLHEVGVLNRQRRQRIGPAGNEGAVELSDLVDKYTHRPSIRYDVVHRERAKVLTAIDAEQGHPYQGCARQGVGHA
ncbi:hypothetical protein DUGA6_62600 [Duganella sp. HH105]|nr:hypothetical protein DUGA6_62600 [Duganella sp. HH105]